MDTAGQVDRYQKRMERYERHVAEEKTRLEQAEIKELQTLLKQQIEALDLSERVHKALTDAGLASIGDVMNKLEAGDRELLALEGVGPKAVEEVKERLEAVGLVPA